MAKRERHAMKNHYEVFYKWSNDPFNYASCGAVSFENGNAKSYGTIIAKVVQGMDGKHYMLETTQSYSVTTSKHQNYFHTPKMCVRSFRVPHLYADRVSCIDNLRNMVVSYISLLKGLHRVSFGSYKYFSLLDRANRSYTYSLDHMDRDIKEFMLAFGVSLTDVANEIKITDRELATLGWQSVLDMDAERDASTLRATLADPASVQAKLKAARKRIDLQTRKLLAAAIAGTLELPDSRWTREQPLDYARRRIAEMERDFKWKRSELVRLGCLPTQAQAA